LKKPGLPKVKRDQRRLGTCTTKKGRGEEGRKKKRKKDVRGIPRGESSSSAIDFGEGGDGIGSLR